MLRAAYELGAVEAGCDEAGRGCLAGPVYAAAVILPPDYAHPLLNDSKKLTARQRDALRKDIERDAVAYGVAAVSAQGIDRMNILHASIHAMHKALDKLSVRPQHIIVDGNRFKPYGQVPHHCIVKGDGLYQSIAAASVLAKTYRDEFIGYMHRKCPQYGWDRNKAYPTAAHYEALRRYGPTVYHRQSFKLQPDLTLF